MPYDSAVLSAVVKELKDQLSGAKINKIHQPNMHTLVLKYHSHQGNGKLLLSSHPKNGRLHLSEASYTNPDKAPMFAMVMRKWLDGAKITDINCTDCERVASICFENYNEIGDIVHLKLIIEIMGKHSNIILVNSDGIIIDGIRRYGSSLSRWREVLPGRIYKDPPPINKLHLPPSNVEELANALYATSDANVSQSLQRNISGLSPMLAEQISLSAGISSDRSCDTLGLSDMENIFTALCSWRKDLDSGSFSPTLRCENSRYTDFAAIAPMAWPQKQHESCHSMNEAVDKFYQAKEHEQNMSAHKQQLLKLLRTHINRLQKKIAIQESDLARCETAQEHKESGDLLAAYIWQLEKGMESIELPSFENPDQMIKIKLDPALSPQENVQRCYRKYAKAKHSYDLIYQQLEANRAELDYVLSIEQPIMDSESFAELEELEKEMIASGYLRPVFSGKSRKSSNKPAGKSTPLPPRRYISSDGFVVLIGRNNRQNDRLSLKQAAEHDIWLHTQKIAGSHVIIVTEGKQVPEQTINEAASWAAWFSHAKDSSQVPVDILQAGRLKKPPGSKPGYVIYTGQKTKYVVPCNPIKYEIEK